MKQFFVFINDSTEGPFPQDEIEAKIKSGEYPYDILIADAEKENASEDDWMEAVDVLKVRRAGVGLRMAGKSDDEEKRLKEAREEKIDPDIRVKLMRYGLADSISVDKFSPEQAVSAVAIYEKAQKNLLLTKWAVGIGGFALACGIFSVLFDIDLGGNVPHRKLLAPVTELCVSPNPDYASHAKRIANEIMQLKDMREEVAQVEFILPKGKPVGSTFLDLVEIPNDQREFVTATANFKELTAALGEISNVEVLLAKNSFSSSAKKALGEEIEERILLNSPRWSNEELSSRAMEEIGTALPSPRGVKPFSDRFLKKLGELDCDTAFEQPAAWAEELVSIVKKQDSRCMYYFPLELERIKTRVDSHGNLPAELSQSLPRVKDLERLPKDGSSKSVVVAWACREMPAFLDKFNMFLKANTFKFSKQARQKRWEDYLKKQGDAVSSETSKLADVPAVALDENNSFTIAGNASLLRNACLRFKVGEETIIVPSGMTFNAAGPADLAGKTKNTQKAFELENFKSYRPTKADFLESERYIVLRKEIKGGTAFFKEAQLNQKKIPVVKCMPELYYIAVTRDNGEPEDSKRRVREIILAVPESDFNAIKEGDKLTVAQLSNYEIFTRPMDPTNKSQLRVMPKNLADAYFEKQKEIEAKMKAVPETPAEEPADEEETVPAEEENSAEE